MKNSNFFSKFNFVGVAMLLLFVLFYCPSEAIAQAGSNGGGQGVGFAPCDFAESCKIAGKTYKCVEGVQLLTTLISSGVLLPANQAINTPQYIVVNDNAMILFDVTDITYTFFSSHILMGESAQIRFIGGNVSTHYTFENTTVAGCNGKKWKQIRVGPKVLLTAISSTFKDATIAAVRVSGTNSALNISECNINDNVVGIGVSTTEDFLQGFTGSEIACNASISGTKFKNNTVGIYLENVLQFSIGRDYALKNEFESSIVPAAPTAGIRASIVNSLTVINATFKNLNVGLIANPSSLLPEENCNLYQDGKDLLSFDNCNIGIDIVNYNATVKNNTMNVNNIGIQSAEKVETAYLRNNYFSRNFITTKRSGISFTSSKGAAKIINNEVNMTFENLSATSNNFGVNINQTLSAGKLISVIQNIINVPSQFTSAAVAGIQAQSVLNLVIKSNDVRNLSGNLPSTLKGISLTSCRLAQTINNNVYSAETGASGIGYYFENSQRGVISCNSTNKVNFGFQFSESNDMSSIQRNFIKEANIGLKLDVGDQGNTVGVIGQQKNNENKWPNSTVSPSYEANSEVLGLDLVNSLFYLTSLAPSDLLAEPRTPLNDWFKAGVQSPTVPLTNCVNISNEEPLEFLEEGSVHPILGLSAMEVDYLSGTYNFNQAVFEWDFKYNLWKHLHKNPIVKNSFSSAISFYANNANSSLGILATAELQIADIWMAMTTIPTSVTGQYNSLTEQINSKTEELNSALTIAAAQQIMDDLAALNTQLVNVQSSIDNLGLSNKQAILLTASTILSQLNNVITTTVSEENMKSYWAVRLGQIINGTSTESLITDPTILDIAQQCRNTGGFAVQNARYLLRMAGLANINFNSNCNPVAPRSAGRTVENVFSVSPNPSNEFIMISAPNPTTSYEMNISNILGETVLSTNVVDRQLVDLKTLGAGVYFIGLSAKGVATLSTKLVIQRN